MSNWIKDIFNPQTRQWEEFYRNRWQHDKRILPCGSMRTRRAIVAWQRQRTPQRGRTRSSDDRQRDN